MTELTVRVGEFSCFRKQNHIIRKELYSALLLCNRVLALNAIANEWFFAAPRSSGD